MKPLLFFVTLLLSISAYSKTCVCAAGPEVRDAVAVKQCLEVADWKYAQAIKDVDCDSDYTSSRICDWAKEERDAAPERCEYIYTNGTSQLILIVESTKVTLDTFKDREDCNAARKSYYKEDCE
ncbi:MAG: hypothetical protein HUU57_08065 [Bdellovibrio sp.]|nr:hypothetical protein [Bdellovibrio sp.]